MMVAACGLLAATSCSDFYDYNDGSKAGSGLNDSSVTADKTLWENIESNQKLSDFAKVLKRVGYDEKLNMPNAYTVWAPVNGSFDTASVAALSDEKVKKEFLNNLIANYVHRENDPGDTVIYMLNEKLLRFSGQNTGELVFDGKPLYMNPDLKVFNYPCTNGLLYLASAPAEFRYNAYEFFFENPGVTDLLAAYVKKYETRTIDEANSVKGPIINGVQTYDHLEVIIDNELTKTRLSAQLENEDSLYTVLLMNDETWAREYEKIASYYNYIPKITWQNLSSETMSTNHQTKGNNKNIKPDTGKEDFFLTDAPVGAEFTQAEEYWRDSIVKKHLTDYMIFSEIHNKKLQGEGSVLGEEDSLYTTGYKLLRDLTGLDAAKDTSVTLSNGHAHILNAYPFSPKETYARVIRTREVGRVITEANYSIRNIRMINPPSELGVTLDEDDDDDYVRYVETDLSDGTYIAPEIDFYLPNVLSTTYDIYVVFVPASIAVGGDVNKPYSLFFDLNYTDASNKQVMGRFNPETGELVEAANGNDKKIQNLKFTIENNKIDTVKVGRMKFPICYYGTDAYPNLKVIQTHSLMMSSTKEQWEQKIRVANVILRPVSDEE